MLRDAIHLVFLISLISFVCPANAVPVENLRDSGSTGAGAMQHIPNRGLMADARNRGRRPDSLLHQFTGGESTYASLQDSTNRSVGRYDYLKLGATLGPPHSQTLDGSPFGLRSDAGTARKPMQYSPSRAPAESPDDAYWDNSISPSAPGIDGSVFAFSSYENRMIVGGQFSTAGGLPASNIASWDGNSWTSLGSGLEVSGDVRALAVYSNKLIVGGYFASAGGVSTNNIASWDGTSWTPLGAGMDSYVLTMVVFNGQLIAGGYFSSAGDSAANFVASWDGTSWTPLGSGLNGPVYALIVYDNKLIVGGEFALAGGDSASNIAVWDGSNWASLDAGVGGSVFALTVYENKLIAGGYLTVEGSSTLSNIASWDGTSWMQVGSGFYDAVWSLTVYDSQLVASVQVNDAYPLSSVVKWDGASWIPVGFGVFDAPRTLGVHGDKLIAGGGFWTAGGMQVHNIASWDGVSWLPLGSGLDGPVYALTEYDNKLIVGGEFTLAAGVSANHIASWDGTSWTPLESGLAGPVLALTVYDGRLIAAFEGDDLMGFVAAWDGTSWTQLGYFGFNAFVVSLTVYENKLIASGDFSWAEGIPVSNVASWDGTSWSPLGSGLNGGVYALTVYDDRLIAGGYFGFAGDVLVNYIASWDGTSWSALGSGLDAPVTALAVHSNQLISVRDPNNGDPPNFIIAAWDGASWNPLGHGMMGPVYALASCGSRLVAGGTFSVTADGSDSASNVVSWDGTSWTPLGSGTNGTVRALAVFDQKLAVGGDFTLSGNKACGYLSQWTRWTTAKCAGFSGLFCDDFEAGLGPAWSSSGPCQWQVLNGVLHTVSADSQKCYLSVGDSSWHDYVLELEVRSDAGHNQVIGFRQTADTGYTINIRRNPNNTIEFDGPDDHREVVFASDHGVWYHVTIRCQGSRITVTLDGQTKIDYTDPTPVLSGGVHLSAWADGGDSSCEVGFDNVKVSPINPHLSISPSSLSFTTQQNDPLPASKSLLIMNVGEGTLNWSISDNGANWLDESPQSGNSNTQSVVVSVNTSSILPGSYDAIITVSSSNAENSPQTVGVNYVVAVPPPPHISLDQTNLSFSGVRNGVLPASQTFAITNSGGGTLNWTVSESLNSTWLDENPKGPTNSNSQTITVSITSTNFNPGTYKDTIVVSSTNADNHPQKIAVTLTIAAQPNIALSPTNLSFNAVQGGSLPANQFFVISNVGGGTLSWSLSEKFSSGWLDENPKGPANSNSQTITVSITNTNLNPGTYKDTIIVTSGNADNSPQKVSVTLVVTSTCTTIGSLQICADNIIEINQYTQKASGNVRINNILFFKTDLIIDKQDLSITGNGAVEIHNVPYVTNGIVTLWSGSIDFSVQNNILRDLVNPALSQLKMAGLRIQLNKITLVQDGVALEGNLEFPNLLGTKISITNLSVTHAGGIRLAGSLVYNSPIKVEGLLLKDLNVTFDTQNDEFGGGLKVEVPNMVTIGAHVTILRGDLNEVSMTVGLAHPIPIDQTGLSLAGGSGSVQHISKADPNPLLISLTVNITGGFSIAGYAVIELNQMGIAVSPLTSFEASGRFKVFGQLVARGSIYYKNSTIAAEFSTNLLNVYDATFGAALSGGRITGNCQGVLQIPNKLDPWLAWTHLAGKQLGNANAYFANATMSGDLHINKICAYGNFACISLDVSFKLLYNGGTDVDFFVGTNYDNLYKIFLRSAGRSVVQGFSLPPQTPLVIFSVKGNLGEAPSFALIGPDGVLHDSTDMAFVRSDEDSVAVYIVTSPAAGTWQVQVPDTSQNVTIEAHAERVGPSLQFLTPSDSSSSGQIRWIGFDPEGKATIYFYYDTDGKGFDGTPINDSAIPANDSILEWDYSNIAPGTYQVYAAISDTFSAPYVVYAPGTITVTGVNLPSAPTGLIGTATDSSVILTWDYDSSSRVGYVVRFTDDTLHAEFTGSQAVDDTNSCELANLVPGRYYRFAVSTYDSLGKISLLSNSTVILFKRTDVNNPPLLTSITPPPRGQVSTLYQYGLTAVDLDGDLVSFIMDSVPAGLTISSSSLNWTPDSSQIGPHTIRILATDNRGGFDSLVFTVVINESGTSAGFVRIDKGTYIGEFDAVFVTVEDIDLDANPDAIDSVQVKISSTSDQVGFSFWLHETATNTASFSGTAGFAFMSSIPAERKIKVKPNDKLTVVYSDVHPAGEDTASAIWRHTQCCFVQTGNVDCDPADGVDISDLSWLVDFLYVSFLPLCCEGEANVDGQPGIDISDLSALVDYLYVSFTPPAACQ